MKNILIILTMLLFLSTNLFAKNDELKMLLKQNVGKYIQVFIKLRLNGTNKSAKLKGVLTDTIILEYGNWKYFIKIDEIQYVIIID